jgi:hypothetical protein
MRVIFSFWIVEIGSGEPHAAIAAIDNNRSTEMLRSLCIQKGIANLTAKTGSDESVIPEKTDLHLTFFSSAQSALIDLV